MKLLRKYYLVFASIVVLFIFIGMSMNLLIIHLNESTAPPPPTSPLFFAKLIDRINTGNRRAALQELQEMNQHEYPFSLQVLDGKGNGDTTLSQIPRPTQPYTLLSLIPPHAKLPLPTGTTIGIIQFKGEPEQYLLVLENRVHHGPPRTRFLFLSTALLLLSVLLGIGFALATLYWLLGKKVALADSVISELQKGNLKARFPIKKHDEFGAAMTRFNKMADEIEHLVEKVRQAERSRMVLLQDLAHDLRTPIASLKNILETIHYKGDAIKPEFKEELFLLSLKEVLYFEKLVEDLLILAQVSEPRYQNEKRSISLIELLKQEAESIEVKTKSENPAVLFEKSIPVFPVDFIGNNLLLKRMIKNALDNAFSFAKSKVTLNIVVEAEAIMIEVEDDGGGFSAEALAAFGVRRLTRYLGSGEGQRLSVGLGSVILKTVVEIHRGTVTAENRVNQQGKILGARIRISFPRTDLGVTL